MEISSIIIPLSLSRNFYSTYLLLAAFSAFMSAESALSAGGNDRLIPVSYVGSTAPEEVMGLPFNTKLDRLSSRISCLEPVSISDMTMIQDARSEVQLFNVNQLSDIENDRTLSTTLGVPLFELFPNLSTTLVKANNDSSVAMTWLAKSASMIARMRIAPQKIQLAEGLSEVDFYETCGDRYINEVTLGATLVVSIQLKMHSQEQKRNFEMSMGVKNSDINLLSAVKNIKEAGTYEGTLEIRGMQMGGKAEGIAAILGAGIVKCDLKSLKECDAFDATMNYLSKGFPGQFASANINMDETTFRSKLGVPISYATTPYRETPNVLKKAPFLRNYKPEEIATQLSFAQKTAELRIIRSKLMTEIDRLESTYYREGIVYVGLYQSAFDRNVGMFINALESADNALQSCNGLALDNDYDDCELLYSNASAQYFQTKSQFEEFDTKSNPGVTDMIKGCFEFAHPWPKAIKNVSFAITHFYPNPIMIADMRTHLVDPNSGKVCYLFQGPKEVPVSQISNVKIKFDAVEPNVDVWTNAPTKPVKFSTENVRTTEYFVKEFGSRF